MQQGNAHNSWESQIIRTCKTTKYRKSSLNYILCQELLKRYSGFAENSWFLNLDKKNSIT